MIYNRGMSLSRLRLAAAAALAALALLAFYLAMREVGAAARAGDPARGLSWRPAGPEDLFRGTG